MADIQIASVFTALGFKVDKKDLVKLQGNLKLLKRQILGIQKIGRINIDTNLVGLRAAKKELNGINAELARIKAKRINVGVNRSTTGGGRGGRGRSGVGGSRLGSEIGQFGAGVGVLGAIGFAGAGILKATQQMEAIESGLLAATGGADGAKRAMDFLLVTTQKLGINFADNARSFTNFSAAARSLNLGVDETEKIFLSFASAGRVLGLSTADVSGVMKAVTQIMSKGTVQAEELRGQLGERLPGAVGLMSKALGVSVEELNKLLEVGGVISKDALPKMAEEVLAFAEANGALDKAMMSNLSTMERMKNAFFFFQVTIGRSGFVTELTELFLVLTGALTKTGQGASAIGLVFSFLTDAMTALVKIFIELNPMIIKIGFAIAAMMFPFTRGIIIISLLILAFEDLMRLFTGQSSLIGRLLDDMNGWVKIVLVIIGVLLVASQVQRLWTLAIVAWTTVTKAAAGFTLLWSGAMAIMRVIVVAGTAAMWLWNAAMVVMRAGMLIAVGIMFLFSLATTAALLPIILIVAGIALLVAGIAFLFGAFGGENLVANFFQGMWDWIIRIKDAFLDLGNQFSKFLGGKIGQAFAATLDFIGLGGDDAEDKTGAAAIPAFLRKPVPLQAAQNDAAASVTNGQNVTITNKVITAPGVVLADTATVSD